MKITCFKTDLMGGIRIALRAVPSKTTMPILESFLIDASSEEIKIITNDNDMGIETSVIGTIDEPGKIAINAKIFSEIIGKLPENLVTIETDSNFKVKITCEETKFDINGQDTAEFPELPAAESENRIVMSQFTLKELIRQTIFSIAQNDNNSIMRGELFEVKGENIKIVSLDSHRISIRNEKLNETYKDESVIVPGKTLIEISRILSGEKNQEVEIIFDKRFIKFSFDYTIIVSRLIEGEYFNVEKMISNDYSTAIKVDKNALLNEVDRAITLTRESEKKPIIMEIKDGEMDLSLSSSLGTMNGHIDIYKEGADQVIGFNPRFFIDALKVIDDDEISIYFVNSNAPCFICNDTGSYIYIILPVNINR